MLSRWGGFRIGKRVFSDWLTRRSPSASEEPAPSSVQDFDYTKAQGIWNLKSTTQFAKNQVTPVPDGQTEYTTPGTYSWTAPAGVTSVCVVCVGGGGGGIAYSGSTIDYAMNGGGGGGLGWKNNISVTPGQSYTVVVGAGGSKGAYSTGSTAGGTSYFIDTSTVSGGGGNPGRYNTTISGGSYTGDGGGNGGSSINPTSSSGLGPAGGGGAGGYSGNGGNGRNYLIAASNCNAPAGGGGAGGHAASNEENSFGGGGVGIYGEGASGTTSTQGGGGGGSSGTNGSTTITNPVGGLYGGGGGGSSDLNTYAGNGSGGAVRIIWGEGRSFPSTATGDI